METIRYVNLDTNWYIVFTQLDADKWREEVHHCNSPDGSEGPPGEGDELEQDPSYVSTSYVKRMHRYLTKVEGYIRSV
jgi:hypothetical protein